MNDSAKSGGTAPVRSGRGMRIALILSLAVNLLFMGLLSGAMLGGHWRGRHGMAMDVGFGPLTAALSRDDRRALRQGYFQAAPDHRAERDAAVADFSALVTALRAEPWDRATFEAVLMRQGERGQKRLGQGRAILLAHIDGLSEQDRRGFADRIDAALD